MRHDLRYYLWRFEMALSTVASFVKTFTNTQNWPTAWAVLSCGHGAKIEMRPALGECTACGAELVQVNHSMPRCACGAWSARYTFHPEPHNEAHYVTQLGSEVTCETCEREAKAVAWLKTLKPGEVHHSRFKYGANQLYRATSESPSGFFHMGSVPATAETEAILRALHASPLSPTEPA